MIFFVFQWDFKVKIILILLQFFLNSSPFFHFDDILMTPSYTPIVIYCVHFWNDIAKNVKAMFGTVFFKSILIIKLLLRRRFPCEKFQFLHIFVFFSLQSSLQYFIAFCVTILKIHRIKEFSLCNFIFSSAKSKWFLLSFIGKLFFNFRFILLLKNYLKLMKRKNI